MTQADVGAVDTAALVDYQDGAVVSRQVIKDRGGSITVFAFDAGEGLSEHSTPHEAVAYVLDGVARIEVGGKNHRVATGQLVRLPAGVPHALHAEQRFKMLLVMVRGRSE
jgi:quercetin dioxygenase-like cupin family protein